MNYRSLLFVLFALSLCSMTAYSKPYQIQGDGQVLPWPWGTECPFPWSDIEGVWTEKEPKTKDLPVSYFQFEIVDEWWNGTHVFLVTHYDENGEVLASGRGSAPKGHRIVRAVLLPKKDGEEESYSVIVRAYTEDRFACSDDLITVLTMRTRGASPDEDVHLIISKANRFIEP